MDRDKFVAYALGTLGLCLWLSDIFVANAKPMGPSFADKIAEACLPSQAERKVVEWAVNENGEKSVTVTTQQFVGTRKGTAQYEIVGTAEVK